MQFERFDNLFDALADTLAESAKLELRFAMLAFLARRVRSWELSPKAAALRLGIPSTQVEDILRSRLNVFSFEALIDLIALSESRPASGSMASDCNFQVEEKGSCLRKIR